MVLVQTAMKRLKNISLPLLVLGILFSVSISRAQVTATARVTLTVIPGPGITFTPVKSQPASAVNQGQDGGITIHTSSNVAVMLTSPNQNHQIDPDHSAQGVTKTITSKDLHDVSKVEVVYLGS